MKRISSSSSDSSLSSVVPQRHVPSQKTMSRRAQRRVAQLADMMDEKSSAGVDAPPRLSTKPNKRLAAELTKHSAAIEHEQERRVVAESKAAAAAREPGHQKKKEIDKRSQREIESDAALDREAVIAAERDRIEAMIDDYGSKLSVINHAIRNAPTTTGIHPLFGEHAMQKWSGAQAYQRRSTLVGKSKRHIREVDHRPTKAAVLAAQINDHVHQLQDSLNGVEGSNSWSGRRTRTRDWDASQKITHGANQLAHHGEMEHRMVHALYHQYSDRQRYGYRLLHHGIKRRETRDGLSHGIIGAE